MKESINWFALKTYDVVVGALSLCIDVEVPLDNGRIQA